MARICSTSQAALPTARAGTSRGMMPHSAMASIAASSTLSQLANLFSSVQMRAITSRLYRGIILHLYQLIDNLAWELPGTFSPPLIINGSP